jgi:polyisoprenyl-phosphate glycosyltransferase
MTAKSASIVIPLFNETAVLGRLVDSLGTAIALEPAYVWEVVLVDDGSSDDTVAQVHICHQRVGAPVRLIRFSRNFGHQAALAAGIGAAKGDAVICMDADLQDPPELIREFLRKFEEGYDVVYAIRDRREGSMLKKLAYSLFYRLFRRVAEISIPLDAGDFGLMSKRAASIISAMPERDVFLRGLRSWVGFRQIGIPYARPSRTAGKTKYSFGKLMKLAGSAFFGFSFLPLRVATSLGIVTVFCALVYMAFALVSVFFYDAAPRGWASVIGVITLFGGAQLICIGILGEYIGRIYKQTQARPLFVISEEILLEPRSPSGHLS